ncbi:rhomboid family intramembrane serine protease [Leptolyngbya sp. 7M]|uniref:rhomboid family intramembrane serine protease n=1 Tax=Leptolyngbya sp. 7M TaxID=2812896 RepID=UPI001B8D4FBB|nr:rhomboid family intramembrane serine protease [Leptolyngbya sp. 7M]QYO68149.1 rhomboid family intramembrane serine protease [Leptolyngbya sp. 7M]
MVPLTDNNPTQTTPYVVYLLILVNVLVFLYQLSLPVAELEQFFFRHAVVPKDLTVAFNSGDTSLLLPELMTLFTSQFLHGGILHIAGNMLFLAIFGNNIEDKMGHFRFLLFYLICGALAALSHWFFSMDSTIPSLGASGAIAGVLGAYILRFPKAKITTLVPLGFFFFTVRIPAIFFLGFWFFQQAFFSVASLNVPTNVNAEGGVAYWAHAGGFVFGMLLAPLFGLFSRDRYAS